MLRVALIVATVVAIGCPSHGPEPMHPSIADDAALRVRVARAEAKRAGGVAELVELANHGDTHARELALRGLGRIGGAAALAELDAALADREPAIARAALGAYGIAASLDDLTDDAIGAKLAAAMATCGAPCELVGLEALGRAGGVAQQVVLAAAVANSRSPAAAAVAAIALGRHGRRKLALEPAAETALVHATSSADRDVRYAAAYALARAVIAPVAEDDHATSATTTALIALIADPDPEVRATAIAGIARRKELVIAGAAIQSRLADVDWRVAVEAVRALASEEATPEQRAAVAASLEPRYAELDRDPRQAQVITEALRDLLAHPLAAGEPLRAFLWAGVDDDLAHEWITALAIAAMERASATPITLAPTGHELPDHLKLAVAADLAIHQDLAARRALLRIMLAHRDARVRAAALPVLATTWHDGDAGDHRAIVATFVAAIGSPDPVIAGAAVDAVPALYDAIGDGDAQQRAALDAAVIARAARERDPELGAGLDELIGKRAIGSGIAACSAGLGGHPVLARAAAGCLKALGESAAPPPIGTSTPPEVDIVRVIGHHVRWHLATTRGELVIDLRPDVAPWNVATIVALTERGFYDGLEMHRVVPDFVAQGGDPTMSGEGGPGFTTPAEPATVLDGPGFIAGGIGMADAGRDSAGSQWFVMHSRAPHLDGRYTWVGQVVSGQNSADSLLIGDKVVRATIEFVPDDRK